MREVVVERGLRAVFVAFYMGRPLFWDVRIRVVYASLD